MRIPSLLLSLSLLAGVLHADPLLEVSTQRYVGEATGIDAIAVRDAHLPALIEQRPQGVGHLRILSFNGDSYEESRMRDAAVGLVRHGSSVMMVTSSAKAISLTEMSFQGTRVRGAAAGQESLIGLRNWKALQLGSTRFGPVIVLAHDAGLTVAGPQAGGRGFSSLIARPGQKVVAASAPYQLDRDDRVDILAATDDGKLLHLEGDGNGGGFAFKEEFSYAADGFLPRAIAGEGRELWIAGTKGGRATLLLCSAGGRRHPWIPNVARGGRFEVVGTTDYGPGTIDFVQLLDQQHLVVAGTRNGRAWVGVVERERRASVHHEKALSGTAVTAIGLNPSRAGWTIAVGSNDKTFTMLRVAGDPAMPPDWSPVPPPPPEPAPTPDPTPEPPLHDPGPTEVGPTANTPIPTGAGAVTAIFPRVSCDARRGLDTELFLVFLGTRQTRVTVNLKQDTGQLLFSKTMVLRRGQRVRLSLNQELAQQRQFTFDGYATVEGCEERDLVVEAVRQSGAEAPEALFAHWR